MISKAHSEGAGYIERGSKEGYLVCGGLELLAPVRLPRQFRRPTVFADVDNRMTIRRRRFFGPVAC